MSSDKSYLSLDGTTFEFDVNSREEITAAYTWPEDAIEDAGSWAEYGYKNSRAWRLEGVITATPWDQDYSRARAKAELEKLVGLADRVTPVDFVAAWFAGQAEILSITGTVTAEAGEQAAVSMDLREAPVATANRFVDIPPARYRHRRAVGRGKGGGAGAKKPASGSAAKKGASMLYRMRHGR